jgi:ABC-type multidrug transport system ATPase subunit
VTPSGVSLAIDVHGLTKRYGEKTVVDHVDIAVEEGRICGFLGPNGSGKTTTLRMLCGLLTPDDGSGTCLGFDLRTQAAEIKRRTGYMTQKFSLYEDLTIAENLEFAARIHGLDRRPERVNTALDRLGRYPAAGSNGWPWPSPPCTSPSCCCSTSPPPASIPRRGATSGTRFTPSPTRA